MPREGYRLGLAGPGRWVEVLNTDAVSFGGSGLGNPAAIEAERVPWHDRPFSAPVTLPPLAVVWLAPEGA